MKHGDETKAHDWLRRQLGRRRDGRGQQREVPGACWRDPAVTLAVTEAAHLLRGRPASRWEGDIVEDAAFAVEVEEAITAIELAVGDFALRSLADGGGPASHGAPSGAAQEGWGLDDDPTDLGQRPPADAPLSWEESFFGQSTDKEELEDCSEAMADFVAWNMRQEWTVSEFRRQALGGTLLTEAQGWDFLASLLPKVLTQEDYARLGLCPATATGRVNGASGHGLRMCVWLVVGEVREGLVCMDYRVELDLPDGTVHRQTVTHTRAQYKCVGYPPGRPMLSGGSEVLRNRSGGIFMPDSVPFFGDSQEGGLVEAMGQSVTADALEVCRSLMRRHPVTVWDALRFLLTDMAPAAAPWTAAAQDYSPWRPYGGTGRGTGGPLLFRATGPLTLTVCPWVRPDDLAAYWRAIRGPSSRTLPLPRSVRMFRFVLAGTPAGERPCWGALGERWRQETGEALGRNVMQTVFRRVRKTLLPGYQEEWEEPDD